MSVKLSAFWFAKDEQSAGQSDCAAHPPEWFNSAGTELYSILAKFNPAFMFVLIFILLLSLDFCSFRLFFEDNMSGRLRAEPDVAHLSYCPIGQMNGATSGNPTIPTYPDICGLGSSEYWLIHLVCEVEILHRYFASLHATLDLNNASGSLISFCGCLDSHIPTSFNSILWSSLRYFGEVQTETSLYVRLDPHLRTSYISRHQTECRNVESCSTFRIHSDMRHQMKNSITQREFFQ